MRNYDYREKWKKLLTPEIISLLTSIHEYKELQKRDNLTLNRMINSIIDIGHLTS